MSTTQDDLASIQNKHGLVQRGDGEIILQQHWAESILIELLLLFPTSKGCEWIQIICLVDPHIKSHFPINSRCCNQSFVNELGLDDGFSLNQWQSSLLNLTEDHGFVVILLVLLFIYGPVNFQICELVSHEVVPENLFFVLLGWVFFGFELNHICWSLSIVVHL